MELVNSELVESASLFTKLSLKFCFPEFDFLFKRFGIFILFFQNSRPGPVHTIVEIDIYCPLVLITKPQELHFFLQYVFFISRFFFSFQENMLRLSIAKLRLSWALLDNLGEADI